MGDPSNGQPGALASAADDERKAIVVAGPTASGKSALAALVASEFGGVVINADSMQVYAGLPVLTAQPDETTRALAPHRLYGVLAPDDPCSVGRWLEMAVATARKAWDEGRLPVVVGGTGLYLRALMEGLAPIPDVPAPLRAEARALLARLGNAGFHERLSALDPVMGARLHPSNTQRLARAWEVLTATGRSLASWQEEAPRGRLEGGILPLLVLPPAQTLRAACEGRFLAMIENGAIDEVRAFMGRGLDPALPSMKALGLPELIAHLKGMSGLAEAVAAAQMATWHYAKRQRTWFRHQIPTRHTLNAQFSESLRNELFPIIRRFLLTPAR